MGEVAAVHTDYPPAVGAIAPEPREGIRGAAWDLLLEAAAAEAVERLRGEGLRAVLLRGLTTARWLYPEDARGYSDVDLLVDPAHFDDSERLLREIGFRRSPIEHVFGRERPAHADTWTRGSIVLDLHRTLVGVGVSPGEVWETLSRRTERWNVNGTEIEVPDVAGRALTLALHMAQHGPEFARTNEDLARAVARVPKSTWVEVLQLARTLHAESALAAGLMATDGGSLLCGKLGIRLDGVIPPDGDMSFHIAQGLLWLSRERGMRGKLRYAWLKLFPPPPVIRSRVAWSRSGRTALSAAYLVRLGRAVRHTPRALFGLVKLLRLTRS